MTAEEIAAYEEAYAARERATADLGETAKEEAYGDALRDLGLQVLKAQEAANRQAAAMDWAVARLLDATSQFGEKAGRHIEIGAERGTEKGLKKVRLGSIQIGKNNP